MVHTSGNRNRFRGGVAIAGEKIPSFHPPATFSLVPTNSFPFGRTNGDGTRPLEGPAVGTASILKNVETLDDFEVFTSQVCDPAWLSFWGITAGSWGPDSHLDIAGIEENGQVVQVLHGNGLGNFTAQCGEYSPDRYTLNFGAAPPFVPPPGITSGHLNGGTRSDIVVAFGNKLYFLLGKGDGTFQYNGAAQYSVNLPSGALAVQALVSDLDQDGFGDLISANHDEHNISVFINQFELVIIGP